MYGNNNSRELDGQPSGPLELADEVCVQYYAVRYGCAVYIYCIYILCIYSICGTLPVMTTLYQVLWKYGKLHHHDHHRHHHHQCLENAGRRRLPCHQGYYYIDRSIGTVGVNTVVGSSRFARLLPPVRAS